MGKSYIILVIQIHKKNVILYISHEIEQGRNTSHWIKEKSNQVCFGGSTAVMRSI